MCFLTAEPHSKAKGKPGASQLRIYYHRMWGQLSTTCSNALKQPNGELLVAVSHNQLQTIASERQPPCLCRNSEYEWPHCHSLPDFHCPVSISVEQYCWACIRWCGTGGFQEQGECLFIGLAASSISCLLCFPYLFFHSMSWYCGAGVFGVIEC